jgi:ATP-dependent RNA helicase RhlE
MPDRPRPGHTRGGHEDKKPHAPEPGGFAAFGLRPELLRNIEHLGWLAPSPIQHELIPLALAGHDLFGVAQTGTGKTAAFALPVLQQLTGLPPAPPLQPYCIILAPTRELVQQIEQQFALLGAGLNVRTAAVFGGVSDRPQISALNAGVEVVAAAPGRLLDLMGQGWLNFSSLRFCVLDEADRMFDMGFINDIRKILNRMPSRKQTLLLSATLPGAVKQLAAEFLFYPREVRIGPVAPPTALKHELWPVPSEAKQAALMTLFTPDLDSALVFCRTRSRADSLARKLGKAGERCAALHSDRTQNQRDRALAQFKAGDVRVLVATDVASRGLDVDGIQLVVNYDVPLDPEDYVHRVGRTARAKREGKAVTFAAPEESKYVQRIEKFLGQKIDRRQVELPAAALAGAEAPAARPARERRQPAEAKPRAADGAGEGRRGRGGRGRQGDPAAGAAAAERRPGHDDSYVEAPAFDPLAPAAPGGEPVRKRRRRGGRGRGRNADAPTAAGAVFDDTVAE